MKKLLIIFLLMSTQCSAQDITVRKKYMDSVKNQLAIYITSTYSLMNSQEDCINEKERLTARLDAVNTSYKKYRKSTRFTTTIFTVIYLILGMVIVVNTR